MNKKALNETKMNNLKPMLTVSQVSYLFNVHPNTVRRWSKQGLIRAYRIGPRGERRYNRQEINALLNRWKEKAS
jgi:excisionase family DNA binding protein